MRLWLTVTYSKVIYELDGAVLPSAVKLPARAAWRTAQRSDLVTILGEALTESLDSADRAAVEQLGADGAATRLIDMADQDFRWDADWWQVLTIDGEVAGCVLPVVYRKRIRPLEDEGTIYHLGVRPLFRGRGIGGLLLTQGASILLRHGVWRVYCDTAATNLPMIDAFISQNWRHLGTHDAEEWSS